MMNLARGIERFRFVQECQHLIHVFRSQLYNINVWRVEFEQFQASD
jgi:hypothetical protein